jgi:hypothetical protein
MAVPLTGVVHGNTVVLDQALPPLEGHRVRVVLEDIDQMERVLSDQEQRALWAEWEHRGEQGPISGADSWPDES